MLNVKADNTNTRDTYQTPRLSVYGGMSKLTASGSTGKPEDQGSGAPTSQPNKQRP
jgi:hypothetical protein